MFDTKTRKSTIASPLWAVVGLYCSDDSDDEGNVDTMDHKEPSKSRRNSTESGASSKSGTCMNRAVNHPLPAPFFQVYQDRSDRCSALSVHLRCLNSVYLGMFLLTCN